MKKNGQPIVNWQYVDLVYDHWLSIGIRPFVELGFMPYDLASGDQTVFWWRGNITPPKDWMRWEWFIEQFIRHILERYGLAEVRRWYFEVWNEPSLNFFWKDADFTAYMELYERTARTIKRIDPQPPSWWASQPWALVTQCGVPPWGRIPGCVRRSAACRWISSPPTRTPPSTRLTWKEKGT